MAFPLQEEYGLNFGVPGSASRMLDRTLATSRFSEAAKKNAPKSAEDRPALIYPQFHVLTADKVTRNKTLYSTEAHKGSRAQKTGQHSFTNPYCIPLIGDHMSAPECGTPPSESYGRMVDAKLVKQPESGMGHVAGLGEVTHTDAIDELMSGRWLTGSLGSSVHDAECSICQAKFSKPGDMEYHDHQRGQFYRRGDPKKDGPGVTEDTFLATDPSDKKGMLCYTMINGYQAREYSRVLVPSDDQSVVNVIDTYTMPGSHFTKNGMPMGGPSDGQDESLPTSQLWVPMSHSSRANIGSWGERYIDLVTGQERLAQEMGLLHGSALHEHFERIMSGEDAILFQESFNLATQKRVWRNAWESESIETPAPDADTTATPTTQLRETTSLPDAPTTPVPKIHRIPADKIVRGKTQYATESATKPQTRATVVIEGQQAKFTVSDLLHYRIALKNVETYTGPDKALVRAKILQEGRRRGF